MAYTVKQVAKLSGLTVKALYHYHKIGLFIPETIGKNGYRYYSRQQLETLQQILFYRELDFSLPDIQQAMRGETSRLCMLKRQRELLKARQQRTDAILRTLNEAIVHTEKGILMEKEHLFTGLNKEQWQETLTEQSEYLKGEYGHTLDTENTVPEVLNEQAIEATWFMEFMATALREGKAADSNEVEQALAKHIAFLHSNWDTDAEGFATQSAFLAGDNFHRQMLEGQQIGLSYFIAFAAQCYATKQGTKQAGSK